LLDCGGQDATEAFEDVGHSDEARETLDRIQVGVLKRQVRFVPNDLLYASIRLCAQDFVSN
jgi:cytochrome b involved in lipid metabolism